MERERVTVQSVIRFDESTNVTVQWKGEKEE